MRTLAASQKFKDTPAGRIPVDWQCVKLGDLIQKIDGGVSLSCDDTPAVNGEIGILKVSAVSEGRLRLDENKRVKAELLHGVSTPVSADTVIISRSNTPDLVGMAAYSSTNVPNIYLPDTLWQLTVKTTLTGARFLNYLLNSPNIRREVTRASAGTSSTMKKLSMVRLQKIPVPLPPIEEQNYIGQMLQIWGNTEAIFEDVLTVKRKYRLGLMQQLLTGKRHFTKGVSWADMRLGDLFRERAEAGFNALPLLAITSDQGIIPRDDLPKRDNSNPDKSKYLHIMPGDIGYNTMRMWQGVSALSAYEGIVSPAYTVVTPTDKIDGLFASYLFKFPPVVHLFWRYSQGIVDDTLSLKYEAFSRIRLRIPDSINEQQRIAALLKLCDGEIAALERRAKALRDQKRGLMQRLLTGRVRVKTTAL